MLPLYFNLSAKTQEISHEIMEQLSSSQHIGDGNASRTPAPITQNKKVCVCYDFSVTVDDAICFKTNYSFSITIDDVICFKTSYSLGVTVASP